MDEAKRETRIGVLPGRWNSRRLGGGAVILAAAFATLAFFDRAVAGVLFLAGMSVLLDGFGQFHPLFGLLFPLLALLAAITDAVRGIPDAALRWFLGAFVIFAVGRVLRRRVVSPARPNPALETLTAELAALKARRDRGEITDDEFQACRDVIVCAFRDSSSESPLPPQPTGTSGSSSP